MFAHEDLDLATALLNLQESVNRNTRREVRRARTEFRENFAELKALHEAERARGDRHRRELARLDERTKPTARGLFASLSIKQKAAIMSAAMPVAGVVLERVWNVASVLFAVAKGVHP
jgi:hypothetical protein